jgi:hypothetical protein
MSHRPTLCFSLIAVFVAAGAHAQGIASNADAPREGEEVKGDTKVVEIDEVERGVFVSIDYGPAYYLPLDGEGFINLNPTATVPSTRIGLRVGYDILNNIALDAFVLGTFNQGVINLDDVRAGKTTGDVAAIAPGLGVRFAFITTERFFAFGRVGAGYAFWFPSQLAGLQEAVGKPEGALGSVHVDGAIGVEFHTKLRHVAIGVEADFQALIAPTALGIHVYPTLKYTF